MDSATDTFREISQSYLLRLLKVTNIDTLLGIWYFPILLIAALLKIDYNLGKLPGFFQTL